jgi:endo-1,3-1,4-beta-glycanase ExoK
MWLSIIFIAPLSTLAHEGIQKTTGDSFIDRFEVMDFDRWYISDGWINGSHQGCSWVQRNASILRPGTLQLEMRADPSVPSTQSCAEVQTRERYGHGTYEARIRPAAGSGVVTAFFTYTGGSGGTPHDEIDFEFLGKNSDKVQLNFFASGVGQHEKVVDLSFDATKEFASYAFQWRPDSLRWYINGRLVHEVSRGSVSALPMWPAKIFLSIWNGSQEIVDWVGPFEPARLPLQAEVEWIAFTRLEDGCRFAESVLCGAP